jgi:hypothetical protein
MERLKHLYHFCFKKYIQKILHVMM